MSESIYNSHKETPRQEVSNRSILRIQQLSNQLKEDLNKFDLFRDGHLGRISEVLFVARDFRQEQKERAQQIRWYNFRLCATFGFCHFTGDPPRWDNASYSKLQSVNKGIHEMFRVARDAFDPHTAAAFTRFADALALERQIVECKASPDDLTAAEIEALNRRAALDQLLVALAVIPYRGVLPSLLERFFYGPSEDVRDACFFAPTTQDSTSFRLRSFDRFHWGKFRTPEKWEPLQICGFDRDQSKNSGIDDLFANFLLPFTRGVSRNNTIPSDKAGKHHENWDIRGFAVPAHDTWNTETGWSGGMTGWLVFFLEREELAIEPYYSNVDEQSESLLWYSWLHFTDLVRAYVRRVREASMRDLLEDYALPSGSPEPPKSYFKAHVHQIIGWRMSENEKDEGRRLLEVPFDQIEADLQEWVAPLKDTHWKNSHAGLQRPPQRRFPPGTRRLCRLFLDELRLVQSERLQGRVTEATAVHKTISHEFKKIVPFIETAPRWIRRRIVHWLLGYTIPGFSTFTFGNDGDKVPMELIGKDGQSYRSWIRGLFRLASQIEAISDQAMSLHLPRTQASWRESYKSIESLLIISDNLRSVRPPAKAEVRCILGATLLCALRNTIQHSTKWRRGVETGPDGAQQSCYGTVIPALSNLRITCEIQPSDKGRGRWGPDLLISNPSSGSKKERTGGSAGAIQYYLDRLAQEAGILDSRYPYVHSSEAVGGVHVCRLPSLAVPKRKLA